MTDDEPESETADQQPGDDFGNALGDALSGRVGKPPEETEEEVGDGAEETVDDTSDTGSSSDSGSTGSTGSTDSTSETSSTESTRGPDPDPTSTRRTRSKYAVYLTEEFQDELNEAYTKANAQRVMEDKGEIEKHKHFLEAVLRAGLEHDDLDEYIEETIERY
jgi:hypothetical protein